MQRISTPTSVNGKFVNGNAAQGIKGTQVSAEWLNSVQEELSNIVESSGVTLDPTNDKQVLNALKVIIADYMKTTSASFANGESTAATSTAYALCPVAISVPKGKVLDVTLSFRAVTETDNVNVWIATTASPDTKLTQKALVVKDHTGNTRTSVRLIMTPKASDTSVKVFGIWGGSEGQFFDIEGSYRIGY